MQASDVKGGGPEVINMGSNDEDGNADAVGGDGVLWIFIGAEKVHSIYVGLHEQHFFHVTCYKM